MTRAVKKPAQSSRAGAVAGDRRKPVVVEPAPERVGSASQILDTAARLMRQKGYEATTIRAIALEVGIKAGSIYHHFPSKDDIVQRVVDEGVRVVYEAVVGALAALPPKSSPRKRLETAVRAHLLSSLEHSDYTSASIRAFAFLPPKVREECRVERKKYEDVWRKIIKDLAETGIIHPSVSQDSVRLLLLGAVNWAGEWYRPGRLSIDKIARDFAASIFPSA
jgi:TetR/AcrR family transcriptional regulator, cholesterol catabolism regulator